ncbi:MAG: hypothetical protein ABJF01_06270 [bacterium]
MPLTDLKYNDNDEEHKGFAQTLGLMQGRIDKGTLTRNTSHAYYAGHELRDEGVDWDGIFLKGDCSGSGKTKNGRSQNRIIVALTRGGVLAEGWAVAWRHDDRLLKLSEGFFTRAKMFRSM